MFTKYSKMFNNKTSLSKSKNVNYYDLTAPITSNTVVYPGDPGFSTEEVALLATGSPFQLCYMHMGNHTGTHIDFPAHVIQDGKTSSDFSIQDLIGSGLIIDVPDTEKSITKEFIGAQHAISQNDFIFFKTANSIISKQAKFTENYVYIEVDAAELLIQKGIKLVGIDYISVDSYEEKSLPVHHAFLSNNILIVEGLELSSAPIGRCELYIIPNNIPNMDGLPVRVIASHCER